MNEVTVMRTPDLLAAEINTIKDHTKKIFVQSSIEIGGRLVEAKQQLKHGEWMNWLKESVDYSQSTANNLMKLHEEFGNGKITSIGNLNFESLSYTKALALIGLPAEERDEFANEHDIENMSARELQDAIKAKQEAEERAKAAEAEAEQERMIAEQEREKREELGEKVLLNASEVERLKAELKEAQAFGSTDDVERLQKSLEESENDLIDARNKIKDLEKKLKEKPIEAPVTVEIEKVPDAIQAELEALRKKDSQIRNNEAVMKFKIHLETFGTKWNELKGSLSEIPDEARPKLTGILKDVLSKLAAEIA